MITRHEAYPELAKSLEMKNLFLKREDLHPFGSHKGRSIPVMIDTYIARGDSHFAISSSGNAALAAAFYVEKLNQDRTTPEEKIKLSILVGQHISTKKLRKLEQFKNQYITVTSHDRPLQTLFTITKDQNVRGLRQSTDDTALIGYHELGAELLEIPELQAVFVGTSSGTTAQALAEYFESQGNSVEVHIVQTSSCHPISDAFVDDQPLDEHSIADAIVDQTAIRKDTIVKLLEKNGGSGWIVSNEQITAAQVLAKKHTEVDLSTNSALSVAGLMQAVYTGKNWNGSVVCLVCGD